jgi:hypothetical protein
MYGGLEGNQPFIRATDASGSTVLEQHFQWPSTKQRLPVGDYIIRVYSRSCNGTCGNLGAQDDVGRCEVPVTVEEGRELHIQISFDDSLSCQLVSA